MKFYFFDVTNAHAVRDLGAKPELRELGPYIYKEIRKKLNVEHGGANTIYYDEYKSYTWDQEASNADNCFNGLDTDCSPDDHITVLNPVLALLDAVWPMIPDKIVIHGQTIDISTYKPVIELLINQKLKPNGTQAPEDDLFFKTTVNELLYTVKLFCPKNYLHFQNLLRDLPLTC